MTNVILRPFTRAEYHLFFQQYVPDPLMDPHPYRYQATHVDHQFDYDESRKEWYPTFGIFADEKPVGILSLKRIDKTERKCEIGLMMANDTYKNQGYGTQAMLLGIQLAAAHYDVHHIRADTMGRNTRMQHILEKLGFMLIERVPMIYDMPAGKDDRLVYLLEVHP